MDTCRKHFIDFEGIHDGLEKYRQLMKKDLKKGILGINYFLKAIIDYGQPT
jgi:hypothetical protein